MKTCPMCHTKNLDESTACKFCNTSLENIKISKPGLLSKTSSRMAELGLLSKDANCGQTPASRIVKNRSLVRVIAVTVIVAIMISIHLLIPAYWRSQSAYYYNELNKVDKIQEDAEQSMYDKTRSPNQINGPERNFRSYARAAVAVERIQSGQPSFDEMRGKLLDGYVNAIKHLSSDDPKKDEYCSDIRQRGYRGNLLY